MDDLLNNAPCGFLSFSDNGTILLANRTLLELLGYKSQELEGQRIESILTVAGRIFYQTHFFPLLKLHLKVEEIYLSLRSRTGADVPVLINAVRQDDVEGGVTHCIFMPIRQRSQYEDEILAQKKVAAESARAKDEFLALVSHELRTPLSAILGWAHLMRSGQLDPETMQRAIETIERNALSQSQLIEDILDFSRIISGKLRLKVGAVEPAEVIEAALDVVRPAADAKGIRLQSILDSTAGPVSGDPDRLQQVLWNLLTNAVKFTPKGGRVQVRLERVNSHIEITVSDTGQGITPEFLPYVFERFHQADSSTSRTHSGLGLGMSITRHIVELHGGTIRAQSAGEGQGTTFSVELPVRIMHTSEPESLAARKMAAQENKTSTVMPRLDGLYVFVVDDTADARDLLVTVLRQSGAHVNAAENASRALEMLQQAVPDVLISDIEMPDEDGYTLIRQVRALEDHQLSHIPAIALTAHARAEDRLRALSAGYQLHISKPAEPEEIITAVANLTKRPPKAS